MEIGTRVELHPATDEFMKGDRYGTITRVFHGNTIDLYKVKLDKSGKTPVFGAHDLKEIV